VGPLGHVSLKIEWNAPKLMIKEVPYSFCANNGQPWKRFGQLAELFRDFGSMAFVARVREIVFNSSFDAKITSIDF
jgi:hypothetical protein